MIRRKLAMVPVFLYKRKNGTKNCNHSFAHHLETNNKCLALLQTSQSYFQFLQSPALLTGLDRGRAGPL